MSKTFGNFTFNETSIKDVYTIDVKKYGDNRGYFMETYKEADFKAAGLDYSNVIKTTVFVKDLKDFAKVNEIYSKYFISSPARSCVEVRALPKGVLIETEAIAEEK